jgi:hypothetical protein
VESSDGPEGVLSLLLLGAPLPDVDPLGSEEGLGASAAASENCPGVPRPSLSASVTTVPGRRTLTPTQSEGLGVARAHKDVLDTAGGVGTSLKRYACWEEARTRAGRAFFARSTIAWDMKPFSYGMVLSEEAQAVILVGRESPEARGGQSPFVAWRSG